MRRRVLKLLGACGLAPFLPAAVESTPVSNAALEEPQGWIEMIFRPDRYDEDAVLRMWLDFYQATGRWATEMRLGYEALPELVRASPAQPGFYTSGPWDTERLGIRMPKWGKIDISVGNELHPREAMLRAKFPLPKAQNVSRSDETKEG